jgi:hypothetical protein
MKRNETRGNSRAGFNILAGENARQQKRSGRATATSLRHRTSIEKPLASGGVSGASAKGRFRSRLAARNPALDSWHTI